MSRWVSFFVLVGVLIVIAAFFVRVMAEFLVPLFVALVLVVVFRPLHVWVSQRVSQRPALAAFITTSLVSLLVFLPFAVMFIMAAAEGRELVKRFDRAVLLQKLTEFRDSVGLNFPHAERLIELEKRLLELRNSVEEGTLTFGNRPADSIDAVQRELLGNMLSEIETATRALGEINELDWPESAPRPPVADAKSGTDEPQVSGLAEATSPEPSESTTNESSPDTPPDLVRPSGSTALEQHWFNYVFQLQDMQLLLQSPDWEESPAKNRKLQSDLVAGLGNAHLLFREFKVRFLGGPVMAWLKETVHPQDEDVDQYSLVMFDFAKRNFVSWGGSITLHVGRLVFGSVIVVVALYFFLLDGPTMIEAFMQISPMDRRHEAELIAQFDRTSRAVVVASLAAAIAQGLLAGVGFYFAGVQSVVLLTMLTMLLAMVPFLGAASVWVPVVLYVGFFENQPWTAFFLFLYSALIVSMCDNVIKPYILHGQSNLHPLLALLSVIGGVTALGPIGIMLGPMLVVFLQTILKMLKQELLSMEQQRSNSAAAATPRSETAPEPPATPVVSPSTT
ncbi:MAG: AI-2E family transporter [Planctomycetaceae bacterium]|nr:AI-2E family transporter [Planctomycetaceae bacterium]